MRWSRCEPGWCSKHDRVILLSLLALAIAAVALLWLDGTAEVVVYEIALVVAGVAWWRRMAAADPAGRLPPQHPAHPATHHSELARPFGTSGCLRHHRVRSRAPSACRYCAGWPMTGSPPATASISSYSQTRRLTLLGPEAWILIGPGDDRSHPSSSVPLDRIERVVAALERL